ncbi:MAG: hypothetical protein AAGF11_30700 [Myxococcota bacterium]
MNVVGGGKALWGVIATVASVCTIACSFERPKSTLHGPLRDYFAEQGVQVDAVRCNGRLSDRVGSRVECEATIGDQRVEVVMEIVAEQAPPVVRPRSATLITARIEPEIEQRLRAEGRPVTQVRCQGRLWVIRTGIERRCEVIEDDGRRLTWIGTFTGEGSHHRARLVPQSPGVGGS